MVFFFYLFQAFDPFFVLFLLYFDLNFFDFLVLPEFEFLGEILQSLDFIFQQPGMSVWIHDLFVWVLMHKILFPLEILDRNEMWIFLPLQGLIELWLHQIVLLAAVIYNFLHLPDLCCQIVPVARLLWTIILCLQTERGVLLAHELYFYLVIYSN